MIRGPHLARRQRRFDRKYVQTQGSQRSRPPQPTAIGQADLFNGGTALFLRDGEPGHTQSKLAEPLLDAGEAAELLRVPRSSLYELVRSRGLPHVRVGSRGLRFVRSDLAQWVTDNTYGRR